MKVSNHAPLKNRKASKAADFVPAGFSRRYPVGAELLPDGGVHFRVWAPKSKSVAVETGRDLDAFEKPVVVHLHPEQAGYFSGIANDVSTGTLYKFRLDSGSFPDPASRFQ